MKVNEDLLINYIENFEKVYVKDLFDNYKEKGPCVGYLINLENYEDLRTKLKTQSKGKNKESKILDSNTKLKTLEIKTSKYLIKMLLNGNKYIIINEELWNLFGVEKKNNTHILYYIDKGIIIFKLDDNFQLSFLCPRHNNIIDKYSIKEENNANFFSKIKSEFEEIEKTFKQIKDYYDFEKELSLYLNQNIVVQKHKEIGYLVDQKWVENWKENTHYDEIKENFKIPLGEMKLKNKLIFFNEINKIELPEIIIKKFETINSIQHYLENNSLALVNFSFIYNFNKTNAESIYYFASKNNLELCIHNDNLSIKSFDNILTLKTSNESPIYIENQIPNINELNPCSNNNIITNNDNNFKNHYNNINDKEYIWILKQMSHQ